MQFFLVSDIEIIPRDMKSHPQRLFPKFTRHHDSQGRCHISVRDLVTAPPTNWERPSETRSRISNTVQRSTAAPLSVTYLE
jgi:hypothetical protein